MNKRCVKVYLFININGWETELQKEKICIGTETKGEEEGGGICPPVFSPFYFIFKGFGH